MKKRTVRRTQLRRTALTLALGALVAAGAAQAQSSAVGSIFGSGMEPGTVVTVRNNDTGFQRQITVDASGGVPVAPGRQPSAAGSAQE